MHCTADTANGGYIDDPTESQLAGLIAGLGHASGDFVTINPADDTRAWYASASLLPGGAIEIEYADPDRGEHHQATVTSTPGEIARTLTTWLANRTKPDF